MGSERELHVFVCSALGLGHYTAVARLANELANQSYEPVRVSFLAACRASELQNGKIRPLAPTANLAVRVVSLDGVDPINMSGMLSGTETLVAGMEDLVAEANQKGWPDGRVVIHDPFAVYVNVFLKKCKPSWRRILLYPSNVLSFMSLRDMPRVAKALDEGGMIPFGCSKRWGPLTLSSLCVGAAQPEPVFERYTAEELFGMDLPLIVSEDLGGLLSSSVLEGAAKKMTAGQLTILPMGGVGYSEDDEAWAGRFDEHKVWLDDQQERSVLFIAMGSLYRASPRSLLRLARAVLRLPEMLKVLWICSGRRSEENDKPLEGEEGEWQRLRAQGTDRILFAEWTDQRKVLGHAAIRGFVSHCGWNSLVENLTLGGVPQLCVPLGSEQFFNAALVCQDWEVGLLGVQLGEETVAGFKAAMLGLGESASLRERVDRLRQCVKQPDFLDVEDLLAALRTLLFSQYGAYMARMGKLKHLVNEFDRNAVLRRLISYVVDEQNSN